MSDVLFGDIEAALIDALTPDLSPVELYTVVPSPRPSSFVTFQRLGGVGTTVVTEDATVAVECWGETDGEAQDLAQVVRYRVHQLPGRDIGGILVYRVEEFAGPARLPDPVSNQPRFTFTLSIHVRGNPL